ncbi:hypothetical protein I4U23_008310 [Adineta vaga]|nr:hypothetical protein I4U23_008310 [Adineta vaga]
MQLFFTFYFIALLCITLYYPIQARTIHDQKTSLNLCQQFLNLTDCYYFSCLDSVHQCGRDNILVQFSYRFCEAVLERVYKSLTSSGKQWSRRSQICLMEELNHFSINSPSSTCTDIDRFVLDKYPICLTQSHASFSICSIMCDNLAIFLEIFNDWNLSNPNLKRLFLKISHLCQEQPQIENAIDINRSNIPMILWSLCLDSSKTQFRNFHPNEIMIRNYERSGLFANFHVEEH